MYILPITLLSSFNYTVFQWLLGCQNGLTYCIFYHLSKGTVHDFINFSYYSYFIVHYCKLHDNHKHLWRVVSWYLNAISYITLYSPSICFLSYFSSFKISHHHLELNVDQLVFVIWQVEFVYLHKTVWHRLWYSHLRVVQIF